MDPVFLGIEIGGTKLQLALGTGAGHISERRRLTVDRAAGAAGIRRQIEQTLPGLLAPRAVAGIGVGFGGPVDWRAGRICVSHHVEGWSAFDLCGWLHGLTGLPVAADNDANVAALGEARCGAGAGANPVFYVTLGSGVGGGLVVEGSIYHGAPPGEAELGHVRLDRQGTILESRCSGWAVDARIRRLRVEEPASLLARMATEDPGGEARDLGPALAAGDPAARRILDELALDLAFGLSHVTHLFHPEKIVVGGGLAQTGESLRAAVAAVLPGLVMDALKPGPQIELARLGADAVPVGALLLASAQTNRPQ